MFLLSAAPIAELIFFNTAVETCGGAKHSGTKQKQATDCGTKATLIDNYEKGTFEMSAFFRLRAGWSRVVTAVCLTSLLAVTANNAKAAVVVVDDFMTLQQVASPLFNLGGFGPVSNTIATGGALGGWRNLTLSGFTFNKLQNVSMAAGGGFLDYQSGAGSTGTGVVTYDGNGAGLGNALAGTLSFDITLLFFNPGLNPSSISIAVSDGINTVVQSSGPLFTMTMVPVTLNFNYALSGLNFNNITKVVLSLNNGAANGADMTLERFVANTRQGGHPVPEPSTLFATGGLLGLALAFRQGRRWISA